MQAMVLAAGFGTRLRPLTDEKAKPACPVAGRPLLHYPLSRLADLGVNKIVINTHHLPETISAALLTKPAGIEKITLLHEPVILGTGGGLKNARDHLESDFFLLINGDTICDADLAFAIEQHKRNMPLATLVLLDDPRIDQYGAVETNDNGEVTDLAGLRRQPGQKKGLFVGIHVISRDIFSHFPAQANFCLVRDVYLPLLDRLPGSVQAVYGTGRFHDLGTPASYLAANWAILNDHGPFRFVSEGLQEIRPGIWLSPKAKVHPEAKLEPPVLVGPGATIEARVKLGPQAIVGANAHLLAGVHCRSTVIWDDATIKDDCANMVVTPACALAV